MNEKQLYLNSIIGIVSKIATIIMIVPIIISFIKFNYFNKPLKTILGLSFSRLFILLIIQLIAWATMYYKNIFVPILNKLDIHNMNFISILSHLSNFWLLGWYFSLVIENKKIALYVKWVSLILFFSAIINYLFIEGYKTHNVFNSTVSNVFCFVLPMIHLWYIYNEDSKVPINKNPYFWIGLGLMMPNLLGFITSIIGKKLRATDLIAYLEVDIVYGIVQIIGYLFIALGFYYARYTKYLPQNTPSVKEA